MEQYEQLKLKLLEQLNTIPNETSLLFKQSAIAITICNDAIEQLKVLVSNNSFKTQKEEIYFFKHLKPEISARLIYHIQVYQIETSRPSGTEKQLKKYFGNHLKHINNFKKEHILFYQYYRSDGAHLDEKYFIRSKSNLHLILDNYSYNYDVNFNTSHDQKVAKIIAYDLLTKYLHKELNKLERNLFSEHLEGNNKILKPLKWTDNKNALVELIYAIHSSGSFNNGNVDVKEIAAFFETSLGIDLGDLYRIFHGIKSRKTNPTQYIDVLKENLTKRMSAIDEKLN